MTAVAGALRNTAVEAARDGITYLSDKAGQAAGAGLAVGATAAVDAAGYHPSPLIAIGAAYTGMKVGGLVGKAMNAGLDRVTSGQGGGPIGTVMTELSTVLQLLDGLDKGIKAVTDSVNKAQAYYQKVSKGANSNLVTSANRHCRRAPVLLAEGMDEARQAQEMVGKHLILVATTRK